MTHPDYPTVTRDVANLLGRYADPDQAAGLALRAVFLVILSRQGPEVARAQASSLDRLLREGGE